MAKSSSTGPVEHVSQLGATVVERLQDTALYYPACGGDVAGPVQIFAPVITDFWFVDLEHFTEFAPERSEPALRHLPEYILESVQVDRPGAYRIERRKVESPAGRPGTCRYVEPCVRTEHYTMRTSGRKFRVHLRRGFGVSGLGKVIPPRSLGVFFYRRDSRDGSNDPWFHKRLMPALGDRLVNGGLIVTDGCHNPWYRSHEYEPLLRFNWQRHIGAEAALYAEPFVDSAGRRFECTGYAGPGYGPTLIWEVTFAGQPTGAKRGKLRGKQWQELRRAKFAEYGIPFEIF